MTDREPPAQRWAETIAFARACFDDDVEGAAILSNASLDEPFLREVRLAGVVMMLVHRVADFSGLSTDAVWAQLTEHKRHPDA